MEEALTSLSTYGYLILFFYTLGGGMIAIIAGGVLSYAGEMDLAFVIIIATIANFLGDTLLFYLSRYSKKEFASYLKKQRRNLALAQVLFKKHGDKIIFMQKYVYGIKTLVPIAIGLTKYSFVKFSFLNILASIVWGLALGFASYYAGDFLMKVFEGMKKYPFIMPIVMFILIGGIVLYFKKATKKSTKA